MSSSLCLALFVALLCGALTSAKLLDETVKVKVDMDRDNRPACTLLYVTGKLDGADLPCTAVHTHRNEREKEKEKKKERKKMR
jgi:hypothetical protein